MAEPAKHRAPSPSGTEDGDSESHERRLLSIEAWRIVVDKAIGQSPGPSAADKGAGLLGAFAEVRDVVSRLIAEIAADRAARLEAEARRSSFWANVRPLIFPIITGVLGYFANRLVSGHGP